MKIDNYNEIYFIKKMGNWEEPPRFESFCFDSREVEDKTLFLAHEGETVDANKYVKKAYEKKASFIIAEKFKYIPKDIDIPVLITDDVIKTILDVVKIVREQRENKKIIGITGTTGKTSTKDTMYSVLSEKFLVGKTEGNMNTEWGVPYTFLNNLDKDIIIIEMGMDHPNDIQVLTEVLNPDISIITNISPVHLKYMISMDEIYHGKTDIFRYARSNDLKLMKGDNIYSIRAKADFKDIKTYGKNDKNDYKFKVLSNDKLIKFKLLDEKYTLDLWGEFNIYNSIPSIIIGKRLGMENRKIQKGLKNVNLSSNRINVITRKGKIIINDTYNSSPAALKAVLDEIERKYQNESKVLVLGDMLELGKYSDKYHRDIIKYIYNRVSNAKCFFIGKNFYNLKSEFENYRFYLSKDNLIKDLKPEIKKNAIFLFKASRGLKLEIVVNRILGSL